MGRIRDTKQIHIYLPPALHKEFIEFSQQSEYAQCEIVRNALVMYMAASQHLLPKLANNNETTGVSA